MTFFFLVVGLEAKGEFEVGELRDRSRLALPVVAAIGGMAAPVAIYLAFNAGSSSAHGWGAAMSTDTAFALGALALLTPRAATRLRVFLLTLAVVDDLVALIVIAVAYSGSVSVVALGVAIGLVTAAYPPSREDLERATALTRSFREQPTPELARSAQLGVLSAISPNERLQYTLHPWTSYVFVPLFALANAGIHFSGSLIESAASSPITLGILVGYVAGKPLGILGASWLATRPALHGPRPSLSWP